MNKHEIILLRGLPGSGKSTLAKEMVGYRHFEADMYLETDGVYCYDASKVRAAHDWCFKSVEKALKQGENVVVANTFVKIWEMQRYVDLGFPFRIIELQRRWPNIHGVPEDKVAIMERGWQQLPSSWVTSQFSDGLASAIHHRNFVRPRGTPTILAAPLNVGRQ